MSQKAPSVRSKRRWTDEEHRQFLEVFDLLVVELWEILSLLLLLAFMRAALASCSSCALCCVFALVDDGAMLFASIKVSFLWSVLVPEDNCRDIAFMETNGQR